jgi:hypothetical protein
LSILPFFKKENKLKTVASS